MIKIFLKRIIVSILTLEARAVLWKYKPRIVAITGSVGKTTTKDAIYTALSKFAHVRKSEKSFNSEIGVPLTILGLHNAWSNPFAWAFNILKGLGCILFPKRYPKILVLEVGADRPGDIENTASWLRPHVAVINKIGDVPVHIEFYKSLDDVVREKGALARHVRAPGSLIVNGDDARSRSIAEGRSAILFGMDPGGEFQASNVEIFYTDAGFPLGMTFRVNRGGTSIPTKVYGALGTHYVYPVLAAVAVAVQEGIGFLPAIEALQDFVTPPGRLKILPGIKDTVVIDDTYNASPVAMHEALLTLKAVRGSGRKIAVLGDMLELGKYASEEHRKAGVLATTCADLIFCVGIRAREIAAAALENQFDEKNVFQYEDSRRVGKEIETMLRPGDVVLVKGSQGVRMERIVEEIMANPEQKETLLVRQDEEWKRR